MLTCGESYALKSYMSLWATKGTKLTLGQSLFLYKQSEHFLLLSIKNPWVLLAYQFKKEKKIQTPVAKSSTILDPSHSPRWPMLSVLKH